MQTGQGERRSWVWTDRLAGVIPPLITPLDSAGNVDVAAVRLLVDHLLQGGCTGLFVNGGCGLGPWLTATQRGQNLRAVVAATAGRAPILSGVMLPATGPAREAAQQAEAEGADAIVIASPYYFGVDGDDQQRHVEAILAAVDLPVLLYNIPQCTHHPFAFETVAALSRETRVLGIKDTSGDLPGFQRFVALKRERHDFRVLQGDERVMAAAMLLGGDGLIAGLANVAPRLFVDLVQAGTRGDAPACRELQQRVGELYQLFSQGANLAALMSAVSLLGIGLGQPPEPWVAPTTAQRQAIAMILQRQGLLESARVS